MPNHSGCKSLVHGGEVKNGGGLACHRARLNDGADLVLKPFTNLLGVTQDRVTARQAQGRAEYGVPV